MPRLHPKGQPPDPALPQKRQQFRNPPGCAAPRGASAVGKLPAHTERALAGLLQPQNESLPLPKQLKRRLPPPSSPKPPRKASAGMESGWRGPNAKNCVANRGFCQQGTAGTRGRVRCQSALTPKSAVLGPRVQPKECSPMLTPRPQIPKSGAVRNLRDPETAELWCLRAWGVAVCPSNSPGRAAWSSPSPNSLPLGIPQIRVLSGSCLNRAEPLCKRELQI